jgi:predicted ArsR family transcriptional regulator
MNGATAAVSTAQRNVLVALKRRGEATADELSEALGVSASAVRQHLAALRTAGLVEARQERGHPGRPAERFHATERTESLFVPAEGLLAVEILEDLEAESPQLVDRVFDCRRRRLVAEAAERLDGRELGDRVRRLAELLEEQGYLAEAEQAGPGRYRILLHSCAIWTLANRYGQACSSELEFIRNLLPDAHVDRVTHKTAGAHTCAYEVSALADVREAEPS